MKHPDKVVGKIMTDLQKFIPGVQYAEQSTDIKEIGLPIDPTAQPHVLERIYHEFGYNYLIDYQASVVDLQTSSGIAFRPQYFDHEVSVSISVYDTRTQESIYHQRIDMKELYEEPDESFENNQGGILFTRTSENLMVVGIKKCTSRLKKSIKHKIESESSS